MGTLVVTVVATVLGGLVSLASVLLTQRVSERAQERAARRAVYGRLNAAVRDARDALRDCVEQLEASRPLGEGLRGDVELRWRTYTALHAEAHMAVSSEVLDALGAVNGSLRMLHGIVMRIDRGEQRSGEGVVAARERLDGLWARLTVLRDTMRAELGVGA